MKRLSAVAAGVLVALAVASPARAVGGWTYGMDDRNDDGYVCYSVARDGRGQPAWTDTRTDGSCPGNLQRVFDF